MEELSGIRISEELTHPRPLQIIYNQQNATIEGVSYMSDYKLISSDSHVMEPKNLWLDWIDPKYKDRAPYIKREGDFDQWYADGDVKFV